MIDTQEIAIALGMHTMMLTSTNCMPRECSKLSQKRKSVSNLNFNFSSDFFMDFLLGPAYSFSSLSLALGFSPFIMVLSFGGKTNSNHLVGCVAIKHNISGTKENGNHLFIN